VTTILMQPVFDLISTYVHLEPGGGAGPEEVNPDFWARIAKRPYEGMRLVATFQMTEDTRTWEMHPAGDEVLYLLSGSVDIVLQDGDAERVVELRTRGACIVPRGIWHRQIVHSPSEMLFITPGAGSQHRPV
jgi:oxalate decarboxylase/phosphoglucose isomerase-like protein (cupin superfamily)